MNEKVIQNWLALAEYDIATADAMLGAKRYVYVAFMCQQSIEKLLKGIYVQNLQQTPPYTHNLTRLSELLGMSDKLSSAQKELLEKLNYFYLESRYSEDLVELTQLITKEETTETFYQTRQMYQWLLSLMK